MRSEQEPPPDQNQAKEEATDKVSLYAIIAQILAKPRDEFYMLFPLTYGEWEEQERRYRQLEEEADNWSVSFSCKIRVSTA